MNNIYIFPFNDSTDRPNISYIKGDSKSILIDAGGGPKMYKYIMEELTKNNLPYPSYVLLTHYHWDHSFGAAYFTCPVISSNYTNQKINEIISLNPKCVEDFISDELQPLFCLEHLKLEYDNIKDLKLKAADIITESLTIDLGNRIVDIISVPSPHTEGSLVLFDRESSILFIGDACCGRIEGMEFYDDPDLMDDFLEAINEIPYKYIVSGHNEIETREAFLVSVEE